ncbi:MAG TPA: phosphatase PAP2 family protein [Opitutaceae bacterium]|jgi:acid phosphatase (class A)|nr:phosphatase PAP2 family protein [Opitutaceae bacterium]
MNQAKILPVFLVFALLVAPFRAAAQYLPAGRPDVVALLAPPPAPGSAEQAADLAEAFAVYSARTPAEEAAAKAESKFTPFAFARAIGPWFQPGKFPKTEALFHEVEAEAETIIDAGKDYWKRPRPYTTDRRFVHITPEKSFSYPSGHSTRATVFALVFAELFPAKRDALLAIGRDIGWHRVLGGAHYPTDIYAGRVLGQAIVREFIASPAFQHDLGEAKAELAAMAAQP